MISFAKEKLMRSSHLVRILGLSLTALAASACAETRPAPAPTPAAPMVGMANPASVYCVSEKIGGSLSIRDGAGGQYGVCLLPDGTEIEEWALFRRDNPAQ